VSDQLVRRFGETLAVDRVDLNISVGEIYGFLGPNGAGKSTTVRMLTTLLTPSEGSARVAGFDVANQPNDVRLAIGVALQEAALDDKQTGRELLDLQGRYYGLTAAERKRRADDLIGLVDIGDAIDRRVGTYSGGMKRRLDLALALVHSPSILFLDEPTTGLDPVSRASVWAEVRRLNTDDGTTIFLTTQYLEEADQLCDRVGIISKGRIAGEGTPADLKRSIGADVIVVSTTASEAELRAALAGVPNLDRIDCQGADTLIAVSDGAAAVSPVAVALANAGVRVAGLTLRTPTLDDVFLTLTGQHLEAD
jgi:ABC-2 type transport system ATP-binding protein